MYKEAYIKGVTEALRRAGLIKLALSDDAEMQNTTPTSASVDELGQFFTQSGPQKLRRPNPDNTTKRDPRVDRTARGVNWGPEGTPASADTLDRFSVSADTINVGSNY